VLLRADFGLWPTDGTELIEKTIPGAMFIRSKRCRPCIKRREFLEYLDPGFA
jgi:hypothetical protein